MPPIKNWGHFYCQFFTREQAAGSLRLLDLEKLMRVLAPAVLEDKSNDSNYTKRQGNEK